MKAFLSKNWPYILAVVGILFLAWLLLGPDDEIEKKDQRLQGSRWEPESFPLRRPMKGENVKKFQARMNRYLEEMNLSGVEPIAEDGYFGPRTEGLADDLALTDAQGRVSEETFVQLA